MCDNDFQFGPGSSCRRLDFTVLFSNLFLVFVPAVVFFLLAVPNLFRTLRTRERRLLPSHIIPLSGKCLAAVKALLGVCLIGTSISVWVTWETSLIFGHEWSGWLAGAFDTLAALLVTFAICVDHVYSTRPSHPPALYLFLSLLFTASRLRTVSLITIESSPLVPVALSLIFRVTLFLVLQISARSSLSGGKDLPPEDTAGLVSRYFITWVFPLLWRGYSQPLDMDRLGAIDSSLYSLATWSRFEPHWRRQIKAYIKGQTSQPLLRACVHAFLGLILAPLFPCFVYSIASLARPLIVLHVVTFVESLSTADPQPLANGWGLVGATFLVYMVYSLALALAHIAIQRSSLALRGALMEALYRKSLLIRVETARELGSAKASNLMSVDVEAIVTNVQALHDVWTALLMTGFGLYIIWTQIGLAFLATVVGSVLFFASLPILTRQVGDTRKIWAESTDHRVKFMGSVLRHIKAIKMSAYEPLVIRKAEIFRDEELQALVRWIKQILKVSITTNWLGNFLSLVTVIAFTLISLYTGSARDHVTTGKVFTVIATLSLISLPLLMLGQKLGAIVSAWASFKRVEQFLLDKERQSSEGTSWGSQEVGDRVEDPSCKIDLNDATFGVKDKATLIKNISIHLSHPRLWMVIGRVGSGKSSLLQSLLGEFDLFSGSSRCTLGTVGFCSQDPWLSSNTTIRESITFMRPYETKWYSRVLSAVALDTDLRTIHRGDSALVSNLSGGQRQRVALARAVYGKFATLVLDDVFSALDAETEARVFQSLFGEDGLLKDRCVVLVTNQIYRLRQSSWITMLHDGHVVEQGLFDDLSLSGGHTAELLQEFAAGNGQKSSTKERQGVASDALSEPIRDDTPVRSAGRGESRQGSVAWSTYRLYLQAMGFASAAIWIAFVIVTAGIQTATNVYLQAWTTTLQGAPASRYGVFLGGYSGMQLGYLFAFIVAIYNAFVYSHPVASRCLHRWQINGLLHTNNSYFESRDVGQMINRFNSDLNTIDMRLPNSAVNFLFFSGSIVGSAGLIIAAGPYMAAVLAGTFLVLVVLQRFYVRAARELRRMDLASRSPIFSLFSDTIEADGLRTIRAMQAQNVCRDMMTQRTTASQHPAWLVMAVQKWLELAVNVSVGIINTLLVVIAVVTRNGSSAGILAAALTQAATMNAELGDLIVEWTQVEMCITSVERVQEYIELPSQEVTSPSKIDLGQDWLSRGSIVFDYVTARYSADLPPAIKEVTFSIRPGQRVGICGRSGSGKSTLLGVLWRLIEQDDGKGAIYVDGINIKDISLGDYRRGMTVIPQDPLLLELSVRENLDPEGLCDDATIWSALEKSQLQSHVEAMKNRLDARITGDGGNFSRGQRQLLALARAILRKRRILALDEATSSIDIRTDAAIQQTIRESFDDTTIMTIAHRISTIIDYDVVIVMDDGCLVEMGSPQDLLCRPEGRFRSLALENGALKDLTPDGSAHVDDSERIYSAPRDV